MDPTWFMNAGFKTNLKKTTLWALFMDRVQLPQG